MAVEFQVLNRYLDDRGETTIPSDVALNLKL